MGVLPGPVAIAALGAGLSVAMVVEPRRWAPHLPVIAAAGAAAAVAAVGGARGPAAAMHAAGLVMLLVVVYVAARYGYVAASGDDKWHDAPPLWTYLEDEPRWSRPKWPRRVYGPSGDLAYCARAI